MHATANGKALLAFGDGALPEKLPALTKRTITDRAALEAELERARSRGFATAAEELEVGLNAVAAPVFDAGGACIAAVSVSGPTFRLPVRSLSAVAPACRAAADEISASLCYRSAT